MSWKNQDMQSENRESLRNADHENVVRSMSRRGGQTLWRSASTPVMLSIEIGTMLLSGDNLEQ